jgi:hypothetical protein
MLQRCDLRHIYLLALPLLPFTIKRYASLYATSTLTYEVAVSGASGPPTTWLATSAQAWNR